MCDISIREYIRWLPGEPSEPTSTTALTTPERRFVDLRILKPTSSESASDGILPLAQLDWAIAGTSESSLLASGDTATGGLGEETKVAKQHSRWHHWIDSRTEDAEEVVDEGDMFEHPSDPTLTLEKGRMVNPDTGAETDYEELWRSESVKPPVGAAVCCIALQWQGEEDSRGQRRHVRRGLLVRLGQYCQAFARDGDEITVERLKWDPDSRDWTTEVRIGEKEFPTMFATDLSSDPELGDVVVVVGGDTWKVVEVA
ncbi:hypothetical protein VTK56DRAFT_518 [Thermocarpiscus australiensis]